MNPSTIQERCSGPAAPPAAGMSLEQARQVKWLGSRPKPLGELLDEGYLDASRLEWAAKKAYNPRLKEAAQVILDWQVGRSGGSLGHGNVQGSKVQAETPIRVGVSLEEARSTVWPFGPLRGQPMGMLSDTRQLSLKDLAYAIDNAWDDRVRRAAIALMLVRLDQAIEEVPPTGGHLRVEANGRSYAERRQLLLTYLQGLMLGAGLALCLANVVNQLLRRPASGPPAITLAQVLASPEAILGAGLALVVIVGIAAFGVLGITWAMNRLDQRIEAYRRGDEGEERIVDAARRALNGQWVLFRNMTLPGRRGADMDIVLVGPPGLWVLEVKALRGHYRNVGESWYHRLGSRWKRAPKNPSRQARKGAVALKEFLAADGIKTYVSAAVAWADHRNRLLVEDPAVPVWTLDRIEDELGNLWNGRHLSEEERERIVEKLVRASRARKNVRR